MPGGTRYYTPEKGTFHARTRDRVALALRYTNQSEFAQACGVSYYWLRALLSDRMRAPDDAKLQRAIACANRVIAENETDG